MARTGSKILRDPIHGNIRLVDPLIYDLMETPEFQRLRRIRQLGSCFLVFHGAEHSRFGHALGTMELMHLVLERWHTQRRLRLPPEVRRAALAAALLHDVGHGPFSHALEHVFAGVNHELIGQHIILGPLSGVLQAHGCSPQDVVDLLSDRFRIPVLCELLSGQLDVDRMDYLQRDSLYTGVKYGLFDGERILETLVPLKVGSVQHDLFADDRDGPVLAVNAKGVLAVEEFLFSRYFMYWQVYLHRAVRSAELLLRLTLERAREVFDEDRSSLWLTPPLEFLFGMDRSQQAVLDKEFLANFLSLDDYDLFHGVKMWQHSKDKILADLSTRFLGRRLFKGVELSERPELPGLFKKRAQKRFGEYWTYYLKSDPLDSMTYGVYRPGTDKPIRTLTSGSGGWQEISRAAHSTAILSLAQQAARPGGFLFFAPELRELTDP